METAADLKLAFEIVEKELPGFLPDAKNKLEQLSNAINRLISSDFSRLVSVLYRLDIDEKKLRELLNSNMQEDPGMLISNMIVSRQLEKIKSRRKFSRDNNDIDEKEKW